MARLTNGLHLFFIIIIYLYNHQANLQQNNHLQLSKYNDIIHQRCI